MSTGTEALAAPPHAAAASPAAIPNNPKLMDACRQFEGQFYALMLQEMQKTVPDDPEVGDDAHEQQIFQGMMNDAISQKMAQHGTGPNDLADQMYKQLIHAQSLQANRASSAAAVIAGASRTVGAVSSETGSAEDEHE